MSGLLALCAHDLVGPHLYQSSADNVDECPGAARVTDAEALRMILEDLGENSLLQALEPWYTFDFTNSETGEADRGLKTKTAVELADALFAAVKANEATT